MFPDELEEATDSERCEWARFADEWRPLDTAAREAEVEVQHLGKRVSAVLRSAVYARVLRQSPAITDLDRDEEYLRLNFLSLRNTFLGNFLHTCAISLPITPKDEAPVGLMLMAPAGSDQALFDVAASVEATLAR